MNKLRKTILKELHKSTYNSASDKVMGESDLDYWKDYAESKKQSDERKTNGENGILGKLLSDTKMDKNHNVYTKWFPTRFAVDALSLGGKSHFLLFKEFAQYCKKKFGLRDKSDIYMIWLDYTHDVINMISNQTMLNEGSKGENYMFFSNLKQMRRQLDIMINEFDSNMVNDVLNNGHDWADDHITEAKVNIDQVFDFFMNKLKDEDGEYISNMIEEKWSEKYKKSIDCNNPKGFSQRAHCQGRKKRN